MYSLFSIPIVVILAVCILAIDGTDDERNNRTTITRTHYQPATLFDRPISDDNKITHQTPQEEMTILLNMTLCSDKCAGENCKSYVTPINECYSSRLLFPNDPSWSGKDVHDAIAICQTQTLTRTIYDTDNSTCRDTVDKFRIPLNECVGPFGKPRPWGSFHLIHQLNGNVTKIDGDGLSSSLLCEINGAESSGD